MGVNPLALLDGNINIPYEGVAVPSLWDYNEMLVDRTMELQTYQVNAKEELKKYADENDKLCQLIKIATHERDNARNQVQSLLIQIDHLQTLVKTVAAKSSNTVESDSLSDLLFDADTMAENSECNNKYSEARFNELIISKKRRPLPEKGKLVKAVLAAGPLLQSLMVAGPLPRWKNPPSLKPLNIPPTSMNGGNSRVFNQTDIFSPLHLVQGSFDELCGFQYSGVKRQRSQ